MNLSSNVRNFRRMKGVPGRGRCRSRRVLIALIGAAICSWPGPAPAAGERKDFSEAAVEAAFRDGDRDARLQWVWRIPDIARARPDAAAEIAERGAGDPEGVVRQNTMLALEDAGLGSLLPMARQGLQDGSESVRWFARYAAGSLSGNPVTVRDETVPPRGGGRLECRFRENLIGYFGPLRPDDPFGWRFTDEFRRLGYGYAFGDSRHMLWMFPDKPSWRGGRLKIPPSFWKAMEKYEEKGIDFYVIFEFKPRTGRQGKQEKLGYEETPPGWQAHFYEKGLDREIRSAWDRTAPAGWTLLDEFRLHVRDFMRANRARGGPIDGWLFFSEPTRPNFFGNNYENIGRLIEAGIDEAKKISPEAYLGTHGILRPRLERMRFLYLNGATGVYAAAFRRNLNRMPEAPWLEDEVGPGGGWLETFRSFYAQARKWGVVDPRDGRTKVVDMEQFLHVVGEDRGPTREPMSFVADTPFQRRKHADYWARSILLALSTGYVCGIGSVYYKNPFWAWGSPNGIGVQLDVREMRRLRNRDIAGEFERGIVPPPGKDMRDRSGVMRRTLYEIYRKRGREGLYKAMDGYLADRRPDLRKASWFAAFLINELLGRATFVSRLALGEAAFGLRFRDDDSGRMVTALWRAGRGEEEVDLSTPETALRLFQRAGNRGIEEWTVVPVQGRVRLTIGGNPLYVAGEIRQAAHVRANLLSRSRRIAAGERGIVEIVFESDRDLSGGTLEIDVPPGWDPPQVLSERKAGYVTIEPGPGADAGPPSVDGTTIRIPVTRMRNGHTLRVVYGDARRSSRLYDMGEDQFGPISLDHVKMQGNMVYDARAGDGFDVEGLPRPRGGFWSGWPSMGGCGIPDNDPHGIRRDMAVGVSHREWRFRADVEAGRFYQVKVFLDGKGTIDDALHSQRVTVGGRTFDSSRDLLLHDVRASGDGGIEIVLRPDRDGNSMDRFFAADPRENVIYGRRRKIPDNARICYLYGVEIIPEGLGAGPADGAEPGTARFVARMRAADGGVRTLEATMEVEPARVR